MHRAHLRSDQALNVPAKMRRAGRPPNHPDALVTAGPDESVAAEIRPVVGVQRPGQAGDRPGGVDPSLPRPGGLVVNRMQ